MVTNRVVKSTCRICYWGCGILVHVDKGHIIKIEGDPESPLSKGVLCPKGLVSLEYLYHPDRLQHPLKRLGARGEGKWQLISWDEALDMVADGLARARDKYGAESVVFIRGSFKGGYHEEFNARFANVFGSPNSVSTSHMCFVPRMYASRLTYGYLAVPDLEYPPASVVGWGENLSETGHHVHRRVANAVEHGAKLTVIDPRKTAAVERADLWLRLRPGSDLALALGMINAIINEGLYDKAFVEQWTVGFDKLKAHVQNYPLEKVADITWVPAEMVKQTALLYATNSPACIMWGNAIDHGVNSFQTARALCILRAITGNLEIPGGELRPIPPPTMQLGAKAFSLPDKITPEVRQRRITTKDKLLPTYYSALPQGIIRAIRYGDPYPIRAAYVQACNPLLVYSNAQEVYQALLELEFLAVADIFMTPTAALADVVLPVGTYLESDGIVVPSDEPIALVQQEVTRVGQCRSDYEILRDLAQRLGFGEYFWDTEEECLDFILAPAGITFDEFRKIGMLVPNKQYRTYQSKGFSTPSGKVELYSNRLKEWGFDPLPTYYEPPETPYSSPELVGEYPFILTTWKSAEYRHSQGRQISSLRQSHPEPVTFIHPQTAENLGIAEGDWVYIETRRGKIKQRATMSSDIDPRVVMVDYGWWFPEDDPTDLYGWAKSNVNILTDDQLPFNREMGSPNLRGILCKVYKASA